ncbi:MAG: peptidylprolyl isomerase [Verrucomicrobiota bacterium]
MIRKVLGLLVFIVCGLLLYVVLSLIGRNGERNPEEVLVAVNDSELTRGEAGDEVELRIASDRDRLEPDRLAKLRQITQESVSREFVNRMLLLEEAGRRGIKADPAVVEVRWKSVQSAAAPQWSPSDILRIHLIGLDRTRSDVEEGVRIDALLATVMTADIDVTDADIEQYKAENADTLLNPDTVKAEQLFILVSGDADTETKAEKRKLAESVHARLLAGEAFERVAGDYSDAEVRYAGATRSIRRGEPSSRKMDGTLFSMETNTVSPLLELEGGFYAARVVSREEGRMPDNGVLRSAVEQQERAARLDRFMKELEEKSIIRKEEQ